MAMYADLSTINASNDATQILVYANTLTGGILGPMILTAFFLIIMIGSYFAQIKFQGRARMEFSFTVAGFATFGFALLMSLENGLLNPMYIMISLGISIIGIIWLFFSSEPYG